MTGPWLGILINVNWNDLINVKFNWFFEWQTTLYTWNNPHFIMKFYPFWKEQSLLANILLKLILYSEVCYSIQQWWLIVDFFWFYILLFQFCCTCIICIHICIHIMFCVCIINKSVSYIYYTKMYLCTMKFTYLMYRVELVLKST